MTANEPKPLSDEELEAERRSYAGVDMGPHIMGPRYIATIDSLKARLASVEKLMRKDEKLT